MRITLATFLLLALAAACTDTPVQPGDPLPTTPPTPQIVWADEAAISLFTNALKRELSDPEMLALNAQASNVTDGERLAAVLFTLDYLDRAGPPDGSTSCDAAADFAYGSDGVWVVLRRTTDGPCPESTSSGWLDSSPDSRQRTRTRGDHSTCSRP